MIAPAKVSPKYALVHNFCPPLLAEMEGFAHKKKGEIDTRENSEIQMGVDVWYREQIGGRGGREREGVSVGLLTGEEGGGGPPPNQSLPPYLVVQYQTLFYQIILY